MKKFSILLVMILAMVISACSGTANASTPAEPTLTPGIVNTNYANALPVPAQLALGIIQLKDTTNSISVDEATSLLPLWQALRTMSESSTSSQVEINALIVQIQDTMKPAQLQAIADMKLTQVEVASALQQMGASFAQNNAGGTPSVQTTPGAQSSSGRSGRTGGNGGNFTGGGGIPGGQPRVSSQGEFGGGGGGFGGAPGGAAATPATQATIQARAASRVSASNTLLYSAVIAFLQTLTSA